MLGAIAPYSENFENDFKKPVKAPLKMSKLNQVWEVTEKTCHCKIPKNEQIKSSLRSYRKNLSL